MRRHAAELLLAAGLGVVCSYAFLRWLGGGSDWWLVPALVAWLGLWAMLVLR